MFRIPAGTDVEICKLEVGAEWRSYTTKRELTFELRSNAQPNDDGSQTLFFRCEGWTIRIPESLVEQT